MKIKVKEESYEKVTVLPTSKHHKPVRQLKVFRQLLKIVSVPDLLATHFTCEKINMEHLDSKEPCLILMNHSSFIDLKIAATLLADREYHIVCTLDGFVGKNKLMRALGCIPTKKFIQDIQLVKDMHYTVHGLKASILMYPEASYSFDGTQTPLPDSLAKCVKFLKVPVVMIRTHGAFLRDPLYNCLQKRKVNVSAQMEYLLSPEEIQQKSVEEIHAILEKTFCLDYFREQQENHILVKEKFRADGLQRALYRCPHCETEGKMRGRGIYITCESCGHSYELTEDGYLQAVNGVTRFSHIPDWYQWERECVRRSLEEDTYRLDIAVDIYILVNTECIYKVGEGQLVHTKEGFHLTGCDGQLDYVQSPKSSYSLYSDFYWYEIGDMISIGNEKVQYYCFPQNSENVVARTRLATEEMYKMAIHNIGEKNHD